MIHPTNTKERSMDHEMIVLGVMQDISRAAITEGYTPFMEGSKVLVYRQDRTKVGEVPAEDYGGNPHPRGRLAVACAMATNQIPREDGDKIRNALLREECNEIGFDALAQKTRGKEVVKFAHECPPCSACGEPFCETCNKHYADCECVGPHQEEPCA